MLAVCLNRLIHLNLANQFSGALIYDPTIGPYVWLQEEAVAYPYVEKWNNIIGLNDSYVAQLRELDQKCGYADYREKYLTFPAAGIQPIAPRTTDECDISTYPRGYLGTLTC